MSVRRAAESASASTLATRIGNSVRIFSADCGRDDWIQITMSPIGTFETSRDVRPSVAIGEKRT